MRATKEYRLKVTEEAQKIVDQLTLEQKVSLMSGSLLDLNKVTPEQIAAMMGDMLSDDNHYNVVPYPAGGLEEHGVPPVREALYAEPESPPVSRYRWHVEQHSHRNWKKKSVTVSDVKFVHSEETYLQVSASTFRTIRDGDAVRRPTEKTPCLLLPLAVPL